MSGPGVVCIKRKRSLPAPDRLIVEPSNKRNKSHVHYVLQRGDDSKASPVDVVHDDHQQSGGADTRSGEHTQSTTTTTSHLSGDSSSGQSNHHAERRVFHLKRPIAPGRSIGKRKNGDHGIATFVEKRPRRHGPDMGGSKGDAHASAVQGSAPEHFKRPSKRAAVSDGVVRSRTAPEPDLEVIAESLHQFALEEAAKETPKASRVSRLPKLSGQRSREIHRQRVASAATPVGAGDQDVDMDKDEDADYVYDTYVLAPTTNVGAAQVVAQGSSGSVGYLVITEEDEKIWEEYIEDEPSDKDWDSDEDDENAEDWYGADYPEEELAEDDEFDENPYKYRQHDSSDDGQWDSDDHSWSDDEYERQMQPWRSKTVPRYRKYLDVDGEGKDGEADDGVVAKS